MFLSFILIIILKKSILLQRNHLIYITESIVRIEKRDEGRTFV